MKRAYRPFAALVGVVAFSAAVHAQRVEDFCQGANCVDDTFELIFADGSSLYSGPTDVGTEIPAQVAANAVSNQIQGWSYAVKHDEALLTIVADSATTAGTIAHPSHPDTVVVGSNFDATKSVPGGFISAVVLSFLDPTQLTLGKNAICNVRYTVNAALPAAGTELAFVSGQIGPANSPLTDINITINGMALLPRRLFHGQIGGGGPVAEICDNGADDDGDGATDCADSDCDAAPNCQVPDEICDNGADDDGDGATDCADSDCDAAPNCQGPCPNWALYFGNSATDAAHDATGDASFSISIRNATDALAFSLGVSTTAAGGTTTYRFVGTLGADANRLVELIITDAAGASQTPETPNTATAGVSPTNIARGAAIRANDPGDFFAFDLTPGVGGTGFTVGYVSDLDGDENKIPASAADCSSLGEILVVSLEGVAQRPFQRGDADGNGKINVSDAVWIIQVVVGRLQARFNCDDAFDANDDGNVNLSDALPVLAWVFQRGNRLPDPFLSCGTDAATEAGCAEAHPACQ